MNALVLNENPIVLQLTTNCLLDLGYEVISTNDALEAYDRISKGDIDLVVIDLLISYITGYELINKIRQITSKYIKVIILTRVDNDQVISEAFRLGIDEYVTLPFKIQEFKERVSRLNRYKIYQTKMNVVQHS